LVTQEQQLGAGPNTDTVVLDLDGVAKDFGQVRATDDVTIQVGSGEIVTLLGLEASGKSALLRLIISLNRVTHGAVTYDGRVLDFGVGPFVPPDRRAMGMVFNSYAIGPHMTVAENVAYALKVRGVAQSEARERVARILDRVGLAGYEQRPASTLDASEGLRVAIARGLVFDPRLLLMDTPFSSLEPTACKQMRAAFRALQRELGVPVVVATRDPLDVLGISDRGVMIEAGSVQQTATPFELYREPVSREIRDFLGPSVTFDGVIAALTPAGSVRVRLHDHAKPLVHASLANASVAAPNGSPYQLALRPEQITLEPLGVAAHADGDNVLPRVISMLLFAGHRYRATVELPWGDDIVLSLAPDDSCREG